MQDQLASLSTLPPSSFADRPAPGEVLKVLNEHLGPATPPTAPWSEPRIKLTANSDLKKLAYKGLAMKLSEASEVLDDRIDEFVTYVQDHHGLDAAAFGNPAAQATAPVVAVGRVASDALDGGARLNVASVVLETSRRSGAGLRVPLNLGKLRGFSIFPGQIIAVRGINTSGVEFIVDEILEVPLPPSAASAPSLLEQHRARVRSIRPGDAVDDDAMMLDDDSSSTPSPLSVFFAAGPYTADDNLDFEPLHELCARAAAEHVDAVVLAGPFLDADHPLVASGDFDLPPTAAASEDPDTSTLATLFRHAVAPPLAQLSHANPSATVILVPSVRDVLARHVSWPQDALCRRKDMRDLGLPPKMRLVTNPITLSLNEAMLAASSLDVLFELKAEELVAGRPAGGMDPLPRLARHVIEQRHYYPVFPPVDRSRLPKTGTADGIATGAMLDTGYLRLGELCGVKPDIMLLPSTMPPFAEVRWSRCRKNSEELDTPPHVYVRTRPVS
jgi:DNA polymerase alpha subunit B